MPPILHVKMENSLFSPPLLLSATLKLVSCVKPELSNTKGFPALSFLYIVHLRVEFLKLSSSKHLECLKFKMEAECFVSGQNKYSYYKMQILSLALLSSWKMVWRCPSNRRASCRFLLLPVSHKPKNETQSSPWHSIIMALMEERGRCHCSGPATLPAPPCCP